MTKVKCKLAMKSTFKHLCPQCNKKFASLIAQFVFRGSQCEPQAIKQYNTYLELKMRDCELNVFNGLLH